MAEIEGGTVVARAAVQVTADENSSILNLAVAGAASTQGSALGGSVAINLVQDTVDADIASATVTSTGNVTVQAGDTSLDASFSGGVALSQKSDSVGLSIGYNVLCNAITAYIFDSTVTSSDGSVSVSAASSPLLVAVGAGGAAAVRAPPVRAPSPSTPSPIQWTRTCSARPSRPLPAMSR